MNEQYITNAQADLEKKIQACANMLVDTGVPVRERIEKVSSELRQIENELRAPFTTAATTFVVRPDDQRIVKNGVMMSDVLFAYRDIEELVVEEGVVELEDECLDRFEKLRRLVLPASLQKCCILGDSLEEVVFAEGCQCEPRFWRANRLRRVVWPRGCHECLGCTFSDRAGCTGLEEIVGLDAVKRVHVDAFEGVRIQNIRFRPDVEILGLKATGDVPPVFESVIAARRERAESLLAAVRDRSKPVPERVDVWLELTASNAYVMALPEDVRNRALSAELMNCKEELGWEKLYSEHVKLKTASGSVRKVMAELEHDNYSGMQIVMQLTGVRLTAKHILYAWKYGKDDIIKGLLRDRDPQMMSWINSDGRTPIDAALSKLECPDIVGAIETCFPGTLKKKSFGGNAVLWELFRPGRGHYNYGRLFWNKCSDVNEMKDFVGSCQVAGERYIAMGADPLAKNQYLGFGWKDVLEGLKRRYLPTA